MAKLSLGEKSSGQLQHTDRMVELSGRKSILSTGAQKTPGKHMLMEKK